MSWRSLLTGRVVRVLLVLLVVLGVLLTPSTAAADRGEILEDASSLSAPAPEPPPPPPPPSHYLQLSAGKPGAELGELVLPPRDELADELGRRSASAVGYEILGGTVGYVTGLIPLFTSSPDIALLTVPFGVSLGVYLAGTVAGGDGDFGAVFLGQAIGALIAAPFALAGLLCSRDCEAGMALGMSAALVFPIGGAVVGYEMSNDMDAHVASR